MRQKHTDILIDHKLEKMIKLINVIMVFCMCSTTFAQNDLIERLEKQAVEIDSLKRVLNTELDNSKRLNKENIILVDTIKTTKFELAKLEDFRLAKKRIDSLLRLKSDSIIIYKATITDKDNQIKAQRLNGEQNEKDKFEAGKNEILIKFANIYKSISFEELVKSSTQESIQINLQIFQNLPELKIAFTDIEKYLTASDMLKTRYNLSELNNIKNLLIQIRKESILFSQLKEKIGNYQTFNDGLKKTIEKIIALDNSESVYGMSKEIQKRKFEKILSELSSYIFNYDFNFSDYPYLSDVFIEIVKRKQPNPDSDITDLLKKL